MFTSFEEVIHYMETKQNKRSHLELTQIQSMFETHGNFQLTYPTVHIAGTNGKGSTTNFIAQVLIEAGYRVGMYTSPYFETHLDRIRLNGNNIPVNRFVDLANRFHDDFERFDLTFFEIDTFIALRYFFEEKVDIGVIEVGLGGRLDATNVIIPRVSVITNIGFDHMEYLGNTLAAIAFEKAGIIKKGVPCVIGCNCVPESIEVFEQVTKERSARLHQASFPQNIEITKDTSFTYEGEKFALGTLARYQPLNASLAIAALRELQHQGWKITNDHLHHGLYSALWKGRFEPIHHRPDWFIDGAHNLHGMTALVETLKPIADQGRSIHILFSALRDKPYDAMLTLLETISQDITVSEFTHYRMKKASEIAQNHPVKVEVDYRKVLKEWMKESSLSKDLYLITGSLYFLSEVMAYLKECGWIEPN